MYRILADSGSTKTMWSIWNGTTWLDFTTKGFNPYFQSTSEIITQLQTDVLPHLNNIDVTKTELQYYGAGCSAKVQIQKMESLFAEVLKIKTLCIQHDLLGAARALCQKQPGIACILGTGSNSGFYNGTDIIENIPSVGYLWGDQGSGAQMGKWLIQDYFDQKLPYALKLNFEAEGYNREEILNQVYSTTLPSRYLASFSHFIARNRAHEYILALVLRCFESFFKYQVSQYSNAKHLPIHAVGSIAFHFDIEFKAAAQQAGFTMGTVLQAPMQGLKLYHAE